MAHSPKSGLQGFGGSNSVEIFFVLSGFYIALILDKTYSTPLGFYKNRILRLFPIYYIICVLVLIQAVCFSEIRESRFDFPAKALFFGTIANVTLIGSDWLMFMQWRGDNLHFGSFWNSELPLHHMLLVPQSWSIGIELAFYLFAPILCRVKTFTLIPILMTLLVSRFVGFILGLSIDPWTYRFFPFELPMFLIGILLYRFKSRRGTNYKIDWFKIQLLVLTFYLGFSFITNRYNVNRFWQMLALLILICIVVIWGEENSKDKKVGELSYPIYMSHLLVISSYQGLIIILSGVFPNVEVLKDPRLSITSTLIITFVVSHLLLKIVRPFEEMRNRNRY